MISWPGVPIQTYHHHPNTKSGFSLRPLHSDVQNIRDLSLFTFKQMESQDITGTFLPKNASNINSSKIVYPVSNPT